MSEVDFLLNSRIFRTKNELLQRLPSLKSLESDYLILTLFFGINTVGFGYPTAGIVTTNYNRAGSYLTLYVSVPWYAFTL